MALILFNYFPCGYCKSLLQGSLYAEVRGVFTTPAEDDFPYTSYVSYVLCFSNTSINIFYSNKLNYNGLFGFKLAVTIISISITTVASGCLCFVM